MWSLAGTHGPEISPATIWCRLGSAAATFSFYGLICRPLAAVVAAPLRGALHCGLYLTRNSVELLPPSNGVDDALRWPQKQLLALGTAGTGL